MFRDFVFPCNRGLFVRFYWRSEFPVIVEGSSKSPVDYWCRSGSAWFLIYGLFHAWRICLVLKLHQILKRKHFLCLETKPSNLYWLPWFHRTDECVGQVIFVNFFYVHHYQCLMLWHFDRPVRVTEIKGNYYLIFNTCCVQIITKFMFSFWRFDILVWTKYIELWHKMAVITNLGIRGRINCSDLLT